jgi:hypothetical protein
MEMWEAEYRLGMAQAWKFAYLSTSESLLQCQQARSMLQSQLPSESAFVFQHADHRLRDPGPDRVRVDLDQPAQTATHLFEIAPSRPSTADGLLVWGECPKNNCNKREDRSATISTIGPALMSAQTPANRSGSVRPRIADLIRGRLELPEPSWPNTLRLYMTYIV